MDLEGAVREVRFVKTWRPHRQIRAWLTLFPVNYWLLCRREGPSVPASPDLSSGRCWWG